MSSVQGIFRPNDSLNSVIIDAMKEKGYSIRQRLAMRTRLFFLLPQKRQELEQDLTAYLAECVEAGYQLPASATFEGGVLVSSWQDLFQWFLDNWPQILEMIMAIISLFAAGPVAGILVFFALLLFPTSSHAQCAGGSCQMNRRLLTGTTVSVLVHRETPRLTVHREVTRQAVRVRRGLFFRRFRHR